MPAREKPDPRSKSHHTGTRWLVGLASTAIALALGAMLAKAGWRWTGGARIRQPAPEAVAASPTLFSPARSNLPTLEKSIAVLPFTSLSTEQENAFFADGVQDEILTNLAKVADLKVISRTSVMQYKDAGKRNLHEIGQQLGVAYLLEGSVQRAGNQVRVNAQLTDTRTDAYQWAERYDRPLDDVFAIQSEISRAIARQLKAELSPQEKALLDTYPTTDLQAYDLYLRAQNLRADSTDVIRAAENLPAATRLLDEALVRDPKFLQAWCLLGSVHCLLYWQGQDHSPERLQRTLAALQQARSLQPEAGETHLAWADYYYHGFRDYARALAELDLARRTLPNNAQVYEYSGYIKRRQGRWTEAVRDLERSLELDPRNFFKLSQQALTYQTLHRYDDERRTYDRALAIMPTDPITRINRARVALDEWADIRPFQMVLADLLRENPANGPGVDDPFVSLCERTPTAAARTLAHYPREGVAIAGMLLPRTYWEGVVARWEGDPERARLAFTEARAEVGRTVSAQPNLAMAVSLLGLIDAALGHKEQAIAGGRRACELLPISQDAVDGPDIAVNLAQIYAWTGEKTAAVDQLVAVGKVPNLITYGILKQHPVWDDLRGDARFEALVKSLAPKP